jgi:hypothetical protein
MSYNPLTPAQRDGIGQWIREAADAHLHLKDWEFFIPTDPPNGAAAWADTTPTSSYNQARIRVSPDLLLEPQGVIKRALVHELVHLHHKDLLEALEDALASVADSTQQFAVATVLRYIEHMVDTLARVVCDAVDFPDVPIGTPAPLEDDLYGPTPPAPATRSTDLPITPKRAIE